MLPSALSPITPASHTYFADLSGDTLQERMVVLNDTYNSAYSIKVYQDYHLGLIDQFNFDHFIIFDSQCYVDITGDNWKELFVFTSGKQYLYLSIIDLSRPEFLLKEFPIIRKRNIPNQEPGDMGVFSQVTDINNDRNPELIFTPGAGYALEPRAICIWDMKTKRITHRFDHHFGYATPVILDLDGDGFKEIALAMEFSSDAENPTPLNTNLATYLENMERQFIYYTMIITGGNKARAAKLLGIDRATLWRKLKRFGLAE